VLAEWADGWYPGVVVATQGDRHLVQFDDGDRSVVPEAQTRPLAAVAVGQAVQGRFQGGRSFYPGRVTERRGDAVHILYDDGDEEWTSVGMVRVRREDVT